MPSRGLIGFRTDFLTDDPGHRHRQRGVRRLPPVGRRDPRPPQRLAGVRPAGTITPFAMIQLVRPRPVLRRARTGHLRGHRSSDQSTRRGSRRERHPGEEADEHAQLHRRRLSRPSPSRWSSTSRRRWSSARSDECVEVTPAKSGSAKSSWTRQRAPAAARAKAADRLARERSSRCRYPEGVPRRRRTLHASGSSAARRRGGRRTGDRVGVHGEPAAGSAEHRHAAELHVPAAAGVPDHHGHRLDRRRLQPAPAVGSVAGERRGRRVGAAERVPAGARPVDVRPARAGRWIRRCWCRPRSPATTRSRSPTRSGPEAQWTDNAPIGADDFWYLWRQMVTQPGVVDPGRLPPDHVGAVDRGRQAGRGDVLVAVSGVARAVHRHPARTHRQGRCRADSRRAWRGRCR